MLVLSRKSQQQIRIGDSITITVLRIQGNQVRIGIEAPRQTRVLRGELDARVAENPSEAEGAVGAHGPTRSDTLVQGPSDAAANEGTGEKPRLRIVEARVDGSTNRIDRIRAALDALDTKRSPSIGGTR